MIKIIITSYNYIKCFRGIFYFRKNTHNKSSINDIYFTIYEMYKNFIFFFLEIPIKPKLNFLEKLTLSTTLMARIF